MLYRLTLLLSMLALLVGCGSSPSTVPTPTVIPTPTMTSRSTDTIKAQVRTLPVTTSERWSKEEYHIQIVIDNLTADEQHAELLATASEGFEFIVPPQELNQQLQNNARTIVQRIDLIPFVGNQRSYREVNFAFKQKEFILTGTHNFIVQVVIPGRDPLRVPVMFEVTEQYLSTTATPIGEAAPVPESTPGPVESSPITGCPPGMNTYLVQSGDRLNEIARRYNTTIVKIVEANLEKIPDPNSLRIGIELCIP